MEDVAWNQKNDYQFGSAGDDRYLHIWDLRVSGNMKPVQSVIAHDSEVGKMSKGVLVVYSLFFTICVFILKGSRECFLY